MAGASIQAAAISPTAPDATWALHRHESLVDACFMEAAKTQDESNVAALLSDMQQAKIESLPFAGMRLHCTHFRRLITFPWFV